MTIQSSVTKMLRTALGCLLFVAAGVWMIRGGAIDTRLGEYSIIFGWIAGLFFGSIFLISLPSILFSMSVYLRLDPNGLHPTRITLAEIPWSTVTGVSKWTLKRNSWVCLEVQPEDFERLKFTWFYRFFKIMNWPFSKADSVYIPSHDLDISFSELEKTIKAYAYAHNPALRDEM